jgi:hypothetical protein
LLDGEIGDEGAWLIRFPHASPGLPQSRAQRLPWELGDSYLRIRVVHESHTGLPALNRSFWNKKCESTGDLPMP